MLQAVLDGIFHLAVIKIAEILFIAFILVIIAITIYLISGFFGKRIPDDLPTNYEEPPASDFDSTE